MFLEKIYANSPKDVLNEDACEVSIQAILDDFKHRNVAIGVETLEDARVAGIVGEIIVGEGNALSVELNLTRLKKLLPTIQFINNLEKMNREKQG